MTARVALWWPIRTCANLARLGVESGLGNEFVSVGGVKGFVDGSLGSSTAKMFQPYLNEPGSTGIFVTPPDQLREWIRAADAAGLQVAVHAIGDEGNAKLLDIFAEVGKANGARDRRFRDEHAQHLRAADIPRFSALQAIASMQPYHVIDDGRWAEGACGPRCCAARTRIARCCRPARRSRSGRIGRSHRSRRSSESTRR
jgi:predicted amidohydrolase YtcJ